MIEAPKALTYGKIMIFTTFYKSLGCESGDGSPPARHTEAVGGPHGGLGPATIGTLDPPKSKIGRQCQLTVPELSSGV